MPSTVPGCAATGHRLAVLDLAAAGVTVRVNGETVTTGSGAAVLGHPLAVMAWIADELPRFDLRLRAGDVITTGSRPMSSRRRRATRSRPCSTGSDRSQCDSTEGVRCQTLDVPYTLAAGPEIVAIPGPTIVPDRVLSAMHRPMPDLYAGELLTVTDEIYERLPALARTTSPALITISNGHGAWAMALSNTLSRGDRVLVLECGVFAAVLGRDGRVRRPRCGDDDRRRGAAIDPDAVEERLREDRQRSIKAVLMVQTDTASSARNDVAAVRRALDAADHPALLMVDCIASMGCEPYEMDEWGVDVTLAASQKGLMTPPGLGFVWAGPRARRPQDGGHAHALLGLDVPAPGRARSTSASAARRRCRTSSGSARRCA